jgi:hypothetical protein
MRRAAFAALAVVAVVGLLARSAAPVAACVCAPTPLEDNVDAAGTILVGTVNEVRFDPPLSDPGPYEDRRTIMVVSVERYLKGSGDPTVEVVEPGIVVITSINGEPSGGVAGDCSTFDLGSAGRRYLLFLPETSSPYSASGSCSGSAPMDAPGAEEELLAVEEILLGPATLPDTGGEPPLGSELEPLAFGGVVAALTACGVVLLWRRERPGS